MMGNKFNLAHMCLVLGLYMSNKYLMICRINVMILLRTTNMPKTPNHHMAYLKTRQNVPPTIPYDHYGGCPHMIYQRRRRRENLWN